MNKQPDNQTANANGVGISDGLGDAVCQNCIFWARLRYDPEIDEDEPQRQYQGFCRRHAPKATGLRAWPVTLQNDYCGDYSPNLKSPNTDYTKPN